MITVVIALVGLAAYLELGRKVYKEKE